MFLLLRRRTRIMPPKSPEGPYRNLMAFRPRAARGIASSAPARRLDQHDVEREARLFRRVQPARGLGDILGCSRRDSAAAAFTVIWSTPGPS
jgi:hypothetical protein